MERSTIAGEPKRILVVGAGAVGQLLGCLLARRGHQITFLSRPGRSLGAIVARDLDRGVVHTLDRPRTIARGETIDQLDHLIVAVRGDQIDDALLDARPLLGPRTAVSVVPPLLDDLVPRVRRAGIEQPAILLLVAFGAWQVGHELHWYRFPDGACILSGEGDPAALVEAEDLVKALRDAGLRAHARLRVPTPVRAMIAAGYALQMGWELADWDLDRLAADSELAALTSAAMAEAIQVALDPDRSAAREIVTGLPSLEQRARATSDHDRAIWRHHGPKIALQTRSLADALIDRGRAKNTPTESLSRLRSRLDSASRR